jgi:colanic acid/amylovoran biosynthesis glycosyltransferase
MPTSPPKIAYVVKRYPRYSETFIVNEILAHEAAGVEIEIFSLLPPVDTHFQDVISRVRGPVHYLPSDGPKAADFWNGLQAAGGSLDLNQAARAAKGELVRDVHQAFALARLVRSRGISHLHAHFATSATSVARLASRFTGVPYTFTAHAKDIFHDSVSADDLRRKISEAAAVVTVSDFNVAHLAAEFPELAGKIHRIYNGLDFTRFEFAPPPRNSRRIISVGRLVEKKGFPVLVEACALLAGRGVKFDCRIVGTGEQEMLIREVIRERGLSRRVQLVGPRPQGEIVTEIRNSAVFAAPCVVGKDGNRDGLPTVLLEAMALGTPCISTDVTGIPEVVRHNSTGLIVPQHDAAALAEAIQQLLDSPARRMKIARAARALIDREFNVRINAARQRKLFPCLSARRRARATAR